MREGRETILNLATETIEIDSVEAHPKNARQGDIGAIATSLESNGQYRPIVVQASTRRILAGNHTWKAAKSLGWQKISATIIDVDDDTAIRILLADNKANDLASYDDAELVSILQDLAASSKGLEGSLFSTDDLDDLIAMLNAPPIDDVINDLGIHDGVDGFHALIKIKVELPTFEAWQEKWDALEGSDDEKIRSILDRIA